MIFKLIGPPDVTKMGDVGTAVLAADWQPSIGLLASESTPDPLVRHHQGSPLSGHLGNELGDLR